jgi:WD40 repeat protein
MKRFGLYFLFFILAMMVSMETVAQTINTPFGKNRVQYHDDFDSWWMYETENFVSFWYGKGRNIARSVIQMAELDHGEIEKIMAHSMNDKIRIIIYLDHSDYKQTNISYFDTREASGAGLAQFYDNKVIVFFDGDHQHLRRQIRAGIVQAYLNSMFSELSFQQLYQNLLSSDLPKWFVLGLVDYLADRWNPQVQQDLESFFVEDAKEVRKFTAFAEDYPILAGHSMWHFLSDQYGEQAISDFLYLVRIHNDLQKAFKYVYNLDEKSMYRDWHNHYEEYFKLQKWSPGVLDQEECILEEFEYPVTKVLFDAEGDTLFYVTNNYGRVEIWQRDLSSGKERTLMKYGYKNQHQLTDEHYPLLRINPHDGNLGVIYEKRDQLFLRSYDRADGTFTEILFPENVQRIYDFVFEQAGFLLFAGSMDAYSDLFLFNLEKRQSEPISDNYFDEKALNTTNFDANKYLLIANYGKEFLPSYTNDSLPPLGKDDIYMADASFNVVKNLTQSETINEGSPIMPTDGDLLFLSDAFGRQLPQWQILDSEEEEKEGFISSAKSIIHHDWSDDQYVYVYQKDYDHWVIGLKQEVKADVEFKDDEGWSEELEKSSEKEVLKEQEEDIWIEVDESLLFQSEFGDPDEDSNPLLIEFDNSPSFTDLKGAAQRPVELPVLNRSQAVAARLRFNFTELTTRIDNEALFEGLETFDQYNQTYSAPPTGFLLKTTVRDLFEDHVMEGGIRLASDFRGMEYFITYDDLKRKWDWKYALYRKTGYKFENVIENSTQEDKLKNRTHLGMVKAKYPFDNYRSLHFSAMLRLDESIVTASGMESLDAPNINFQRFMLGIEYVFDNSSEKAVNLLSGTRMKVFTRFSNRFQLSLQNPVTFRLSEGIMGLVGFDARHYVDVLKHSTLALRLAGQSSFGSEQNIYFLGGVENWFFSQTDDTYPVPSDGSYAYKVQAGNMRGFPYNVRNGATFTVANIEWRIPVFRYLFGGHIKNSFFRDFQISGFFDAGMAWYGLTPFSDKNVANVYYLEAPPAVLLKIKQLKDPLVGGMGFGIRTTVFGYFLKLDYAWGIESSTILDPMLYFSMGYDF